MTRVRSLLATVRTDGLRGAARRVWGGLFGIRHAYISVRVLRVPAVPVVLPGELNGVVVRNMTAADLEDDAVARHRPKGPHAVGDGIVATRDGRIVGAAWYTDTVTPERPWYVAVAPHLVPPARFTANMFVLAGDKGASFALGRLASDALASAGVRSLVGVILADNAPSIFVSRLLGAKLVATLTERRWLGRVTSAAVEPLPADADAALTGRRR
jgi:hypothetical protein